MSSRAGRGARRFLTNGRAGRQPGTGTGYGLAGLHPWTKRPPAGFALRAGGRNRKPPKGLKP